MCICDAVCMGEVVCMDGAVCVGGAVCMGSESVFVLSRRRRERITKATMLAMAKALATATTMMMILAVPAMTPIVTREMCFQGRGL